MSPETECGLDLEEARDQRRRFRRKPKRARDCRWESPRRALPKRGESLPPLPFPAGRRCLDRKQLRGRHTPWQISEEAGSSRPSEAEAGWTARSTAIRQRHQRRHRREKLYQRQNCRIQSVLPPGTDLLVRQTRRHGGLLERLLHDLPPHLLDQTVHLALEFALGLHLQNSGDNACGQTRDAFSFYGPWSESRRPAAPSHCSHSNGPDRVPPWRDST